MQNKDLTGNEAANMIRQTDRQTDRQRILSTSDSTTWTAWKG